MFVLVGQRTEKGIKAAEQSQRDKVYGTRKPFHFDLRIWSQISKVTSELFESPTPIRAWFKANRANFYGGNSPEWDNWLNGIDPNEPTISEDGNLRLLLGYDSEVETIDKTGEYRFWFMPVEEFDRQHNEWRQQMGLSSRI